MLDFNLFTMALNNAVEESEKSPFTPICLFWDGIDEYGIVPEPNTAKFLSIYPKATLIATFLNGEKQNGNT